MSRPNFRRFGNTPKSQKFRRDTQEHINHHMEKGYATCIAPDQYKCDVNVRHMIQKHIAWLEHNDADVAEIEIHRKRLAELKPKKSFSNSRRPR